VEITNGGLFVCFELGERVIAYPCTIEGAAEFAYELASRLKEVRNNPDLMKKIASSAVTGLIDLLTTKGGG
jgi:hypothetical protein